MTGPYFVDTNVLVYARDRSEAQKQPVAHGWLAYLWQTRQGRLSSQVLQEYYQVVTRRLRPGLAKATARDDIRDLLAWQPAVVNEDILQRAWVAEDHYHLSWWDSLIVASGQQLRCRCLLTEDLQHGQDFDGLVAIDPFRAEIPSA